MTRGFDALKDTDVTAMSGFKVKDMLQKVSDDPQLVTGYTVVLIHVGTNDFGSKEEYDLYVKFKLGKISYQCFVDKSRRLCLNDVHTSFNEFEYEMGNLFRFIYSVNPKVVLLVSSILPRPWDFAYRNGLRRHYNNLIRSCAAYNGVLFLDSARVFLIKNRDLKFHYFGFKGLHLSDKGSNALQTYFSDKLRKAAVGKIY